MSNIIDAMSDVIDAMVYLHETMEVEGAHEGGRTGTASPHEVGSGAGGVMGLGFNFSADDADSHTYPGSRRSNDQGQSELSPQACLRPTAEHQPPRRIKCNADPSPFHQAAA